MRVLTPDICGVIYIHCISSASPLNLLVLHFLGMQYYHQRMLQNLTRDFWVWAYSLCRLISSSCCMKLQGILLRCFLRSKDICMIHYPCINKKRKSLLCNKALFVVEGLFLKQGMGNPGIGKSRNLGIWELSNLGIISFTIDSLFIDCDWFNHQASNSVRTFITKRFY